MAERIDDTLRPLADGAADGASVAAIVAREDDDLVSRRHLLKSLVCMTCMVGAGIGVLAVTGCGSGGSGGAHTVCTCDGVAVRGPGGLLEGCSPNGYTVTSC